MFWCKCVKRKTHTKKIKNLHGNSNGTIKLVPTLLKKKTMYFITVT